MGPGRGPRAGRADPLRCHPTPLDPRLPRRTGRDHDHYGVVARVVGGWVGPPRRGTTCCGSDVLAGSVPGDSALAPYVRGRALVTRRGGEVSLWAWRSRRGRCSVLPSALSLHSRRLLLLPWAVWGAPVGALTAFEAPVASAMGSARRPRSGLPIGAPGRIRTCGPWYRKPVLYPLSYGGVRPTVRAPVQVSTARAGASHPHHRGTRPCWTPARAPRHGS